MTWGEGELLGGGGLLHVDMFAHNKSGIAYRDGNRRSMIVVNHKREPHQQLRLLPSCTISQSYSQLLTTRVAFLR
jgi:hypothetical protein